MRSLLCIVAITILPAAASAALTAVIEVNESAYYSSNKNAYYGGTSLTDFYAPLPVFFEGWKSSPRTTIAEYLWDFGDGSPRVPGFNAAHVYEQPGTYTATLVVTDVNGSVATATKIIHVRERTGTTYYVDSELGQDFHNGTSPATPWRSASKAFEGADRTFERYGPGDRILFRRGQTFTMNKTINFGHSKRYGFMFGAYGEGARPVIQNTGITSGNYMFSGTGNGLAHFTIADLDFRLRNEGNGQIAAFWFSSGEINQLLFLRCSLSQFGSGFVFSQPTLNGGFIVQCTTLGSSSHHIFATPNRFAVLDSRFDLSANHIAYITGLNKGVIYGNTFSRPAFGRHALRISGNNGFDKPANNFYIANNYFRGWIDPVVGTGAHLDGKRYNHTVVHLGPNTNTPQSMEWVMFENNTVVDGEQMITIGCYENLTLRNNLIYTVSDQTTPRILFASQHGFDLRPLRNIAFHDNFLFNGKPTGNASLARAFEVREYKGPPYQGSTVHENISILDNYIAVQDGMILKVTTNKQAQLSQITSNYQRIHTPSQNNTFEFSNNKYNLSTWRNMSSEDFQTIMRSPQVIPVTPVCSSPEIIDEGPITVSYTGAQDRSGSGLKEVVLWYKRGHGSWIRSNLTSTGAAGSFSFEPVLGSGSYYFWAQAEDHAGNRSLPPVSQPGWAGSTNRTTLSQFGDTSTYHGQGAVNGTLPDPNGNGPSQLPPGDPGLLAHYRMDTAPVAGVLDSSDNAFHGVVVPPAVPRLVYGYIGNAYQFAPGDRVILPNIDIPTGEFAVTAWINPTGFVEPLRDGRIISKAIDTTDNGHFWMLSTFATPQGTRLRFRVKTGSIIGPTETLIADQGIVQTGVWQHVAASYRQGVMRLFLNGQLVGEKLINDLPAAKASFVGVQIGNQPGEVPPHEDKSWIGMIDEVRIYSYALTMPQVNELYRTNQEFIAEPSDPNFPPLDQGMPLAAWPAALALVLAGAAASRRMRAHR